MKTFTFVIFFLFLSMASLSQDTNAYYQFTIDYKDAASGKLLQENYKIKVWDTLKDPDSSKETIRFHLLHFRNDSIKNATLYKNDADEVRIFSLDSELFHKYTRPIYPIFNGVRAGIYSIPFKIRLRDFDFEQNINFGINIGLQYRLSRKIENRWILEPSLGIGLASANLSPDNSDVTENRTASALSLSGGLMFHLDKNINIGMFYGFDLLGNKDSETNWKYNKKPWLGIGINIGFSLAENKTPSPNNIK